LDETYERILREIKTPNQGHAHRLLQCLVAAVRPLQVKELAEVLAVDFDTEGIPKLNPDWRLQDEEEAVISACSSLVMIVNDKDSRIVQFSHFSVKEFLTANRLAESIGDVSYYHIRLEAAHTIIAQACLGILLRLDDCPDRYILETFPMAEYAAESWFIHAEFGNTLSRIKDGMECLFDADKPHFAMWLRVRSEYLERHSIITPRSGTYSDIRAAPLFHAAYFGFSDLAEHLIAKHPEHLNASDGDMYLIHIAASQGHAKILSSLLAYGADVNARGTDGCTPLYQASFHGHLEAGKCLLDHGADIRARCDMILNGYTPLHRAVFGGYVDYAQMLLERGAALDVVDDLGNTPLHAAVSLYTFCALLTQFLLDHGADVNARNWRGEAPLHGVLYKHDTEVARMLLKRGADVHARNDDGFTIGQLASRYPGPRSALIELLRQYGDTSV
jgi:ankyrin repeat protein